MIVTQIPAYCNSKIFNDNFENIDNTFLLWVLASEPKSDYWGVVRRPTNKIIRINICVYLQRLNAIYRGRYYMVKVENANDLPTFPGGYLSFGEDRWHLSCPIFKYFDERQNGIVDGDNWMVERYSILRIKSNQLMPDMGKFIRDITDNHRKPINIPELIRLNYLDWLELHEKYERPYRVLDSSKINW